MVVHKQYLKLNLIRWEGMIIGYMIISFLDKSGSKSEQDQARIKSKIQIQKLSGSHMWMELYLPLKRESASSWGTSLWRNHSIPYTEISASLNSCIWYSSEWLRHKLQTKHGCSIFLWPAGVIFCAPVQLVFPAITHPQLQIYGIQPWNMSMLASCIHLPCAMGCTCPL